MRDLGVVIQPIGLLGIRDLDMPGRPVARADRAAHLVVRMRGVRGLTPLDGRRLEDALYPQRDVVNDAGLSADGDSSFQELLMKAGVRLG